MSRFMSRFAIFSNSETSNISNPTVFAGGANSRRWGQAGPSRRRLAQPAPGPAGDIAKSRAQARPGLGDSNPARRRPGPASEFPISLTRLPGLVREILRIFSLFLRAVSPPPRGFEAATCSLARAQRLPWGVARSLQSAYEPESSMPLYRPSDTVWCRVGYVVP